MIRNLLFDFGQVLYAIDPAKSAEAFTWLFPEKANEWRDILHHPVFIQLETGHIQPSEFYETIRQLGGKDVADQVIRDAWNSLLIGPQPGRESALTALRAQYRLALLSNTNQIHLDQFGPESKEILDCFEYRFLSHQIGMRKPDAQIYRYVLDVTAWQADETIFIDDVPANLDAAHAAGMHTLLFTGEDYLDSLQILIKSL